MVVAEAISQSGVLTRDSIRDVLAKGLGGRFTGQRVLVLIPDHTRRVRFPALFRMVVEILHNIRRLDFMVALGTHPTLTEESLCRLVGISADGTADDVPARGPAQPCVGRSRGADFAGDYRPGRDQGDRRCELASLRCRMK